MRSLLDLISKHTDANAIIPVIAIASIIFTIVVYLLLKPKWMKYAIHGVLFFVGGIMFLKGYFDMLQPSGLSLILFSTKVLVFSIIGILFSAILDTLDSLLGSFKKKDPESEIGEDDASFYAPIEDEDDFKEEIIEDEEYKDEEDFVEEDEEELFFEIEENFEETRVIDMPVENAKSVTDETIVMDKAAIERELERTSEETENIENKDEDEIFEEHHEHHEIRESYYAQKKREMAEKAEFEREKSDRFFDETITMSSDQIDNAKMPLDNRETTVIDLDEINRNL